MPNSWCSATRRDPAPPDQPAPLPGQAEHLAQRLGIRWRQRPDQPGVSYRGKNFPVQHLISRGRTARRRNAPSRLRAHRHPRPGPRLRRYALRPARRAPGSWAAQAQGSAVSELRGFAKGLRKDWAAITELTTPYSSGAVEGHVNRIKMIPKTDVRAGKTRPAPQACPARRLTRHGNWARATAT